MYHILSEKGIERKFILYEDNLIDACKNYIDGYADIKAEVAREIFGEIENHKDKIHGIVLLLPEDLAELKKKYTEEKK